MGFRSHGEGISRGCGHGSRVLRRYAESCARPWRRCKNPPPWFHFSSSARPSTAAAFHTEHARLLQLRTGLFGTVQQHAIQVESRIDEQRIAQIHLHRTGAMCRQRGLVDDFLGNVVLDQKRIAGVGLVSEAAATRFLPGELFRPKRRFQDPLAPAARLQKLPRDRRRGRQLVSLG